MYVLLFDIDGTLIHSGGAGRDALDAALLEAFAKCGSECIDLHGCTDRNIVARLFEHHGIEMSEANWERFRDAYLAALPTRLAGRVGRILPGVKRLIDSLRIRDDVVLGLLTGNVREGARLKLTHYGLFEHFAFGGFGDWHHHRDDVAREAFEAARQHLGRDPEGARVWVIGDTPHDVRCARAIGARALAVATGAFSCQQLAEHRPDLVLDDLDNAADWLGQLGA